MAESKTGAIIDQLPIGEGFEQLRSSLGEAYISEYLGQNLGGVHISPRTADMNPTSIALAIGNDTLARRVLAAELTMSLYPLYLMRRHFELSPSDDIAAAIANPVLDPERHFEPTYAEKLQDAVLLADHGYTELSDSVITSLQWRGPRDDHPETISTDATDRVATWARASTKTNNPELAATIFAEAERIFRARQEDIRDEDRVDLLLELAKISGKTDYLRAASDIPPFQSRFYEDISYPAVDAASCALEMGAIEQAAECALKVDREQCTDKEFELLSLVLDQASSNEIITLVQSWPNRYAQELYAKKLGKWGKLNEAFTLLKPITALSKRAEAIQAMAVNPVHDEAFNQDLNEILSFKDPLDSSLVMGAVALARFERELDLETLYDFLPSIYLPPVHDAVVMSAIRKVATSAEAGAKVGALVKRASSESAIGRAIQTYGERLQEPHKIIDGLKDRDFVATGYYYRDNVLAAHIPDLETMLKTAEKNWS